MLHAFLEDRSPRVRVALGVSGVILTLIALIAWGPRPRVSARWVEPSLPSDIDAYLAAGEARVGGLRDGEAKSVVWADSVGKHRTELSVAYVHGFSADRHEVEPLVTQLATSLGANAYFARLRGHGRDGVGLGEARVEDWLTDAAEAVSIGGSIGERVILVGTSTGGTLALWAAAQEEAVERVAAVVLLSPNLGLRDRTSEVLLWPWGGLAARLIEGGERCFEPVNAAQARHWTTCYPTRALVATMALVHLVRTADLSGLRAPVLTLYSPDDEIVDPGATERVLDALPPGQSVMIAVRGAEDPQQHVIAGEILSPGTTDRALATVLRFLLERGIG